MSHAAQHQIRGHNAQKVDISGLRPYVEISACCGWTGSGLTINANNEANRSSQSESKSREPSQWRVLEAWRAAAKRLSVVFSRKTSPPRLHSMRGRFVFYNR
jgi:hypothetical protein